MTRALWPWTLFAAMIAAAGLPIYIHAPKFYVDRFGLSLAALGGVLALLRSFDVVQDPLLGWLADAARRWRGALVAGSTILMALALLGLFALTPPVAPLLWFALMLAALFTAYSFLTIVFYAQGVARAAELGPSGHLRLAGWREAGSLIGVCVASAAPVLLARAAFDPYATFAAGFAFLALVALWAMRAEWSGVAGESLPLWSGFLPVLQDAPARRLLLIALLNAAPVAVSSTLFLFFVESRLQAPDAAGPLLLLFFLAAAASVPLWARLATRFGAKPMLQAGMALSILAFAFALTLRSGDTTRFALISLASGAALGADSTLLPAIFARRLGQIGTSEGVGFGLWAFVSKLSLAFAAATLLPGLQLAGFQPGTTNTETALHALTLLYALLPCGLKLLALALLTRSDLSEVST